MDKDFIRDFPDAKYFNSKRKKVEKSNFGLGQRVPKSAENNDTGWLPLKLEQVDTTKPIIICFGGNGTLTSRSANYYAKLVQGWLCIREAQEYCPIISFYYGNVPDSDTGVLNDDELLEISRAFFLPLIQEHGKRLDLESALKNMRNLNFFTHCYGANVVKELAFNCMDLMDELGYSPNEQKAILSQIVQVGYAPDVINDYTTNFFVKSFADSRFGYRYRKELTNIDEFPPYLGQGKLIRNNNNLTLYVGSLIGEDDSGLDEHGTRYIYRTREWKTFYKRSQGATYCIANVLANAVLNSKKNVINKTFIPMTSIDDLQKINQMTLDSYNNDINEKKQKAIYDKQKADYDELHKVHHICELLQKNNLSEADIINGKGNFREVVKSKQVDFSNSQLGFVASIPEPRLIELGENFLSLNETKNRIIRTSPQGIILNNGETVARYEQDIEVIKYDLRMQCDGVDLSDSLRYEEVAIEDTREIHINYNYGSKETEPAQNLQELQANWQKYDKNSPNLPDLNMSYAQTVALINILTRYELPFDSLKLQAGIHLNKQALADAIIKTSFTTQPNKTPTALETHNNLTNGKGTQANNNFTQINSAKEDLSPENNHCTFATGSSSQTNKNTNKTNITHQTSENICPENATSTKEPEMGE